MEQFNTLKVKQYNPELIFEYNYFLVSYNDVIENDISLLVNTDIKYVYIHDRIEEAKENKYRSFVVSESYCDENKLEFDGYVKTNLFTTWKFYHPITNKLCCINNSPDIIDNFNTGIFFKKDI